MVEISYYELLTTITGIELQCNDNTTITGITIYADLIKNNNIYFCINSTKYNNIDGGLGFTNNEDSVFGFGGSQNGHDTIATAIKNGASIIIIDDIKYFNKNDNVAYILVEDGLKALIELTKYFIKKSQIKVIAVTGSTGKTTTCQAIVDSLSINLNVKKIHRIRNSVLAMCVEVLQELSSKYDCFVIEMQMDAEGQIEQFCKIAQPDISIITNINLAHYSRFKSIEKIMYEKLTVYRLLKSDGFLIINDDDDNLHNWSAKQNDKRILKVSKKMKTDYSINKISSYGACNLSSVDLSTRSGRITNVRLNTTGTGGIYAALFSAGVSDVLNIKTNQIKNGLEKIKSPIGRYNCFKGINGSQVIVDSYNANFISMCQGIEYVSKLHKSKKILILGSMLELAEKTESEHRKLGQFINKLKQEFYIITLGEAAMYITVDLVNIPSEKIYNTFTYEDIVDVVERLSIDDDTVIFLKGSGAMRMEMVSPYLLSKRIF